MNLEKSFEEFILVVFIDNKYRCYTEEGEMILHVAYLLYDIRLGVYISENKHTGLRFLLHTKAIIH